MKNNFDKEEVGRYWSDHQFCAVCRSNQIIELHHIFSRDYRSILTSIPLCRECHSKYDGLNQTTGIKGHEPRKKLLAYTFKWIIPQGKVFNEDDYYFLEKEHKIIQEILKDNKSML